MFYSDHAGNALSGLMSSIAAISCSTRSMGNPFKESRHFIVLSDGIMYKDPKIALKVLTDFDSLFFATVAALDKTARIDHC